VEEALQRLEQQVLHQVTEVLVLLHQLPEFRLPMAVVVEAALFILVQLAQGAPVGAATEMAEAGQLAPGLLEQIILEAGEAVSQVRQMRHLQVDLVL